MDEEVTFSGRFFLFVPIWSKPFVGKICILTTYDIFCMYIYGMRNGKMTLNIKIEDRKGVVLGLVVPFILFWTGILSPLYTDNFLVWVFSLVPFYGYVFGYLSEKTSYAPLASAYNFIFSLCVCVFCWFSFDVANAVLVMSIVNIPVSFCSVLFAMIREAAKDPSSYDGYSCPPG